MHEMQCTYKEAKDLHLLAIDKQKNEQLLNAKRGNKRIEELRKQINSRVDPANFTKKSTVDIDTKVEPNST